MARLNGGDDEDRGLACRGDRAVDPAVRGRGLSGSPVTNRIAGPFCGGLPVRAVGEAQKISEL